MALVGSLLYQPPLAVLAQQAALVWLTSANPAFCSTQLLAHPGMQPRFAAAWRCLEGWAPLLAGPLQPSTAELECLPGERQEKAIRRPDYLSEGQ